ncbi:MAG TPA: GNAT family N-acetyltransferase [Burkholderiales bacterium]|nr:GNAT family N-acetyltransferase [Burkholderiales bacterium]
MYKVEILAWTEARTHASHIRREVFVQEQGVPVQLELDKWDARCEHALASVDGNVIGTGRLLPDGHIGRIAVLKEYRGQGIAREILQALLDHARKRGENGTAQNAQSDAALFYQMFGHKKEEVASGNTTQNAA